MSSYKCRLPPILPIVLIGLAALYILYNFYNPITTLAIGEALRETVCKDMAQAGPPAGASRGRRVFIDLGANDGQSLEFLMKLKERGGQNFDAADWEVYFFELNPKWEKRLTERCEANAKIPKCGDIRYFQDEAVSKPKSKHGIEIHYDSVGTSLYDRREEQAAKGKKGRWREDGCVVDFAKWLERAVPTSQMDEVVLKVDIEGAEYELMEHLNKSGVMKARVSSVTIEWHPKVLANSGKLHGEDEATLRERIFGEIRSQGIKYFEWEY